MMKTIHILSDNPRNLSFLFVFGKYIMSHMGLVLVNVGKPVLVKRGEFFWIDCKCLYISESIGIEFFPYPSIFCTTIGQSAFCGHTGTCENNYLIGRFKKFCLFFHHYLYILSRIISHVFIVP